MGIRRGGVVLLLVLANCSFVAVRSHPRPDPMTHKPTCENRVPPAIDLVLVPLGVGLAYFTVKGPHGDTDRVANETELVMAGVMVASSVAALASSIYGFKAVSSCRKQLAGP